MSTRHFGYLLPRGVTPSLLAVALASVFFCTNSGLAALMEYGDFDNIPPGTVTFTDVTESSGTDLLPLYDEPTASSNSLIFKPKGFTANATGGAADITDGQLNFGLEAEPGTAITAITLSESGDYTLAGSGTVATAVASGIFLKVTILEVDGDPIDPVVVNTSDSDDADLVNDAGIVVPWDFMLPSVDLLDALDDAGIGYTLGVTAANVVLNDTLLAFSESGTIAFIAKKEFIVDLEAVVPEPTTALLAVLAFSGLGLIAGRRRG
jgi:hypothetical protein